MENFPLNDKIREFSSIFEKNGFSLYVVGGAVRDYLLGIQNNDFDFCTNALPDQVVSMFKNVILTGIKHGTVTVLFKGEQFEVTTFRTESVYSDNRHPDSVSFVSSLEEDLSRRDFTVNAFAADCKNGNIIDLFNGLEDLNNKIIRAIGNAEERFIEDALRMFRMCRFAAKLNFEVEKRTLSAALNLSENIKFVSEERIFDEMSKLLVSQNPKLGISLLEKTNLLKIVFPEVAECREIRQNKIGSDDVLEHIQNSLMASVRYTDDLTLKWALFFHDIGKPSCIIEKNGHLHFYQHEIKGEELACKIMKRLKFSNKMQKDVSILIKNHMVAYSDSWTDGAVKRFINRIGKERIQTLFYLQWSDQIASEGISKEEQYQTFIKRIEKCSSEPLSLKDLNITGTDLSKIGIPKNQTMGQILNNLLEKVLDDPSLNTKEQLLKSAVLLFNSKRD